MGIGSYGSSMDAASALMQSGGAMLNESVAAIDNGNLEDAAVGMILSRQAVKAGAVLARVSDEAMQSTLDMVA